MLASLQFNHFINLIFPQLYKTIKGSSGSSIGRATACGAEVGGSWPPPSMPNNE